MYTSTLTTEPDTDTKRCSHCHAPEGSSHPIGNFIVRLNAVQVGGRSQTLCSYCRVRAEIKTQRKPFKPPLKYSMKQWTLRLFHLAGILAVFLSDVLAQPGLPGAPEQAPIDGGLGILAALGGGYALKKLRDKKTG